MNDFKEWASIWVPHVLKAYERSKVPFESLVPGTKVITLRAGFSGSRGKCLTVCSDIIVTEKYRYILLEDKNKQRSCLLENDDHLEGAWYFQILPLTEKEFVAINQMNWSEEYDWLEERLGVDLNRLNRFTSIAGVDRKK